MKGEQVHLNGMRILRSLNKMKKGILIIIVSAFLFGCSDQSEKSMDTTILDNSSVSIEETGQFEDKELEEASTEEITEDRFVLPNWDHYKEQMNQEDQKDFKEYLKVLENEEKFCCFEWDGQEKITFNEYLSSIMSREEPDIHELALLDIDGQNGKELILNIYEGGGNYLVLTRDNGSFYGTDFGDRQFEELQKDGKYLGSGGAGDAYYHRMKIDKNGVEESLFGELHGEQKEDGSYGDRLEVNGEVIEDAQKWIEKNYSDPVDWIN